MSDCLVSERRYQRSLISCESIDVSQCIPTAILLYVYASYQPKMHLKLRLLAFVTFLRRCLVQRCTTGYNMDFNLLRLLQA